MGVFSNVHRFREAGQSANVNNVARFGEPRRSLFTTTKVITLHHRIDILDANENVVYQAQTKFPSLHDKTDVKDAAGRQVAHIEREFFSLHQRHRVAMADGQSFELSNELFHLIKDITNIEGLGWQLQGNILGLNFELYDQNGQIIAVIGQKLMSLHDKYCVDIYQPDYETTVVAILITLQHMIRDRQAASSSSSSSSFSSYSGS
ncbi:MAG: LURP-one-related family protein [Oscillospiraceae bacterium]|nr:LURP-one-related family protein [Oscillospiraceae bacterium]